MYDSSYAGLARELAALPADYDASAAARRMQAVNRTIFVFPAREAAGLREVLTPIQLRLLPPRLREMIAPAESTRQAAPPP